MRKLRDRKQAPRSRRGQNEHAEGTLLTREHIADLIEQFSHPEERCTVDDWPAVARAFVKAARIRGLAILPWLAVEAGYGEPPPPLRLAHGGTRDADVVTGIETTPSSTKEASTSTRGRLREATQEEGGMAMIITGMGPEAFGRAQNRKNAERKARAKASSGGSSKLPESLGRTATSKSERSTSSNAPTPTASSPTDQDSAEDDLDAWLATLNDRTSEGGAMIVVGRHVEAMRQSSKKDDPESSGS